MINLLKTAAALLRESTMGKPTKKPKGKSIRNGNQPSPYTKYRKQPFQYGEGYKRNCLINGILCRDGKPYKSSEPVLQRKQLAAE